MDEQKLECDWCYKFYTKDKFRYIHKGKRVCKMCVELFDVVDVHITEEGKVVVSQ